MIEGRVFLAREQDLLHQVLLDEEFDELDIVSVSRHEHNPIEILLLQDPPHHFEDDIDIDIPFLVALQKGRMLTEHQDEPCFLERSVELLLVFVQESQEIVGFVYLELILEIDSEFRVIDPPAFLIRSEMEVLSVDEGDVVGGWFHGRGGGKGLFKTSGSRGG